MHTQQNTHCSESFFNYYYCFKHRFAFCYCHSLSIIYTKKKNPKTHRRYFQFFFFLSFCCLLSDMFFRFFFFCNRYPKHSQCSNKAIWFVFARIHSLVITKGVCTFVHKNKINGRIDFYYCIINEIHRVYGCSCSVNKAMRKKKNYSANQWLLQNEGKGWRQQEKENEYVHSRGSNEGSNENKLCQIFLVFFFTSFFSFSFILYFFSFPPFSSCCLLMNRIEIVLVFVIRATVFNIIQSENGLV